MSISTKLNNLLETRHITAYRLSKDTGISQRLIGYWKKGEKQPSSENLVKLAEYFKVTTDYLLNDSNISNKLESVSFDDFTYAMYDESRDLTDEQKKMLLDMARVLRERQHREGKDKQ